MQIDANVRKTLQFCVEVKCGRF